MSSLYNNVNIAGLLKQLLISFNTGATTVVTGAPGCGKTQITAQIARNYLQQQGVNPADHYFYYNTSTKTVEWAGGIMMPDGKRGCDQMIPGWIKRIPETSVLVLDEFDKLSQRDQLPFLQLLHEKSIDDFHLPKNVHIVVLANRLIDRGASSGLSTLIGNRCRTISFAPKSEEVLEHFMRSGIHPMVYTYLDKNPNRINAYDPNTVDGRNCTSRSWEAASASLRALGERASTLDVLCTVACSVPDSDAQAFQMYNELGEQLVSIDLIYKDPHKAPIPSGDNKALQYLQLNTVAVHAASMKSGEKYLGMTRGKCKEQVYWYAKRFPAEYLWSVIPMILSAASDSPTQGGAQIPTSLGGTDAAAELLSQYRKKRAILNDEDVVMEA